MRNFRLILKEVTCHGMGFGDWFVCCGDCRDSARHGLCQGGWSGETAAGVSAETPEASSKLTLLQLLPATQGIYGFVIAIVIMAKIGIMGGSGAVVPVDKALMLLAAALPIALVGYFSAIAQGKCAAGSMLMVGRRPEMQGKGMMMTAMVETYAVLALLISFLCVNAIVL